MPRDDRTILRRTHAGHEPSARELWDRHAGWMLAYARTVLGRHGDAGEDVVQSVFCRLLELDRRTVRAVDEVRPWLATLVRRTALNHIRSLRRASTREARCVAADPSDSPPSVDLGAALEALPRRLREVLHLRHVAGLTTDQTAAALGLARGTVASRHHAAVSRLRGELAESDPRTHARGAHHVAAL